MKKVKNILKYIIPVAITFIILGIIYYYNGLYPFGKKPLLLVDTDYLYVPALYRIYDFLHYGTSIIYSDIGLGNSIYGPLIIQGSLFSPLNLLLYLVKRDNIIEFFGLFIMIKLCLITLTSYIYIHHKYKINYFYEILFSLLYTFNGFIILNHFNAIWLDIVILFPLVMLFLDRLLNNKGEVGYIITLALCMIITFYFSYFIIVYILFYSFVNLFIIKKENTKELIFKLGKASLIAFLISAFSSIPLIYQILISSRFQAVGEVTLFRSLTMKSLYLLLSPLLLILFFKLLTKFKEDKHKIYSYLILFIIYLLPVIFDPINAIMHGGDYWSFPYRFGYVVSFLLFDAGLYYVSKYVKDKNEKIKYLDVASSIIIVLAVGIATYLTFTYRKEIITETILLNVSNKIYTKLLIIIGIIIFSYIMTILIKNKYLKYVSLSVITLVSIFSFTSWTFYNDSGYFLCNNARTLGSNMEIPKEGRYRVEYSNYTPGIGYIYNIDAMDHWLHLIPDGSNEIYGKLGYDKNGTSVASRGGTIFTDWLLNMKYLLSQKSRTNDGLTEEVGKYINKRLYQYKYSPNYGVVFDEMLSKNIDDYTDFEYQNAIYQNLFMTDRNIVNYKTYSSYNSSSNNKSYNSITLDLEENSYLYFKTKCNGCIDHVFISGGTSIYDFSEYINYLGNYSGTVKVEIFLKDENETYYDLAYIKESDISALYSPVTYDGNMYHVTVEEEKYLMMPINNIVGTKVYNNGKKVKVDSYLDSFITIKLKPGENNIKVKYDQPFLRIGIILSIAGIILLFLNKRIVPNTVILTSCYYVYLGIIILLYIYFYLYSLFKYII